MVGWFGKTEGAGLSAIAVQFNKRKAFILMCSTPIDRKPRVLHIQGIKVAAVVLYRKTLITQDMECHRLSRRVNKFDENKDISYFTNRRDIQQQPIRRFVPKINTFGWLSELFTINWGSTKP